MNKYILKNVVNIKEYSIKGYLKRSFWKADIYYMHNKRSFEYLEEVISKNSLIKDCFNIIKNEYSREENFILRVQGLKDIYKEVKK